MTPALAQERSASGRISSIPGPISTVPRGATDGGDRHGVATSQAGQSERKTLSASKAQPASKAKPPVKPKAELKLRPGIKRTAVAKRSARVELAPALNIHAARMEDCRQRMQSAPQPSRLIKLAEECESEFPASQFAEETRHIATAARQALEIQRSIGLSGDFFEDSVGDAAYREDLGKAVRGDQDAAYRIALAYRTGISGVVASPRRMEQWLRFSAELGSGLASWELAEFYNYGGFVADAARFEKKALELGYRPPFRLPTRGY